MQVWAAGHETSVSSLANAPTRFRLFTTCQLPPTRCSTSVRRLGASVAPTAMQSVLVAHATPDSAPRGGLAFWTIDHDLPFQCSISVFSAPPGPSALPTAKQLVVAGHAMPESELPVVPGILGFGTMDHLYPFQSSTSARAPPPSSKAPTA